MSADIQDIRDTFLCNQFKTLAAKAKDLLITHKPTILAAKKLPQPDKDLLIEYIQHKMDEFEDRASLQAFTSGSAVGETLYGILKS